MQGITGLNLLQINSALNNAHNENKLFSTKFGEGDNPLQNIFDLLHPVGSTLLMADGEKDPNDLYNIRKKIKSKWEKIDTFAIIDIDSKPIKFNLWQRIDPKKKDPISLLLFGRT